MSYQMFITPQGVSIIVDAEAHMMAFIAAKKINPIIKHFIAYNNDF